MSSKSKPENITKIAQLAIINLDNGNLDNLIDLFGSESGQHLVNDMALDKEGNAYITDSYANVIYKVDKNNQKSIFAESPIFIPDSGKFCLNGIAYCEEGYLIIGKTEEGSLYKISLKDPKQIEKVQLPEALEWVDGIDFLSPTELVVVRNRFHKQFSYAVKTIGRVPR